MSTPRARANVQDPSTNGRKSSSEVNSQCEADLYDYQPLNVSHSEMDPSLKSFLMNCDFEALSSPPDIHNPFQHHQSQKNTSPGTSAATPNSSRIDPGKSAWPGSSDQEKGMVGSNLNSSYSTKTKPTPGEEKEEDAKPSAKLYLGDHEVVLKKKGNTNKGSRVFKDITRAILIKAQDCQVSVVLDLQNQVYRSQFFFREPQTTTPPMARMWIGMDDARSHPAWAKDGDNLSKAEIRYMPNGTYKDQPFVLASKECIQHDVGMNAGRPSKRPAMKEAGPARKIWKTDGPKAKIEDQLVPHAQPVVRVHPLDGVTTQDLENRLATVCEDWVQNRCNGDRFAATLVNQLHKDFSRERKTIKERPLEEFPRDDYDQQRQYIHEESLIATTRKLFNAMVNWYNRGASKVPAGNNTSARPKNGGSGSGQSDKGKRKKDGGDSKGGDSRPSHDSRGDSHDYQGSAGTPSSRSFAKRHLQDSSQAPNNGSHQTSGGKLCSQKAQCDRGSVRDTSSLTKDQKERFWKRRGSLNVSEKAPMARIAFQAVSTQNDEGLALLHAGNIAGALEVFRDALDWVTEFGKETPNDVTELKLSDEHIIETGKVSLSCLLGSEDASFILYSRGLRLNPPEAVGLSAWDAARAVLTFHEALAYHVDGRLLMAKTCYYRCTNTLVHGRFDCPEFLMASLNNAGVLESDLNYQMTRMLFTEIFRQQKLLTSIRILTEDELDDLIGNVYLSWYRSAAPVA